ncbi:MAG TPA: hypothetical protein VK843_03985 [Planctomycetota bacterium]|nr:hypothetical protein [Planctomycetota bacterium]
MLFLPVLLAVVASPVQDGATAGSWRVLPMPSLCRSAPESLAAARLVRGTHLIVTRDDLEAGMSTPSGAAISPSAFASLLVEESRRQSWGLILNPSSPPLLARGPAAGVQAAETLCAELDQAGRALDVELTVWLVRGNGAGAVAAGLPKDAPWASARLRSGNETMLGERSAQSYVHNYSVEVATDSGVAAPIVARALTGDVLHARAMRVRGGTAVYIEGMLDLSRLDALEEFELSATDLGSVQHPRVSALQVIFSGTVASGAPLRVAWGGLGEAPAMAEGSLWIVPRVSPDPSTGTWRVLDTAIVEALPWELPAVSPGGGLEAVNDAGADQETSQPISSAVLAKEGDTPRSNGNARSRPFFVGGNAVVLGPRSEQEGWSAIEDLRSALEISRTKTSEVLVQNGAGFVRLPVANGVRWRVLAAIETTAVVDYDVEIAPETWMPGPRIERSLDGFCAQGLAAVDHTSYSVWTATTQQNQVAERSSVPLGRLELPRRVWRASRGELRTAQAPELVLAGAKPLSIGLRAP